MSNTASWQLNISRSSGVAGGRSLRSTSRMGTTTVNGNGTTLNPKANKAVIMASGGFTHNFDMPEECVPGLGAVQALSVPGHTGEGHEAVSQLGGSFSGRP
jgi:hypothetical protein